MKCVCGYEQSSDFREVEGGAGMGHVYVSKDRTTEDFRFVKQYICPECGTVKAVIQEEPKPVTENTASR